MAHLQFSFFRIQTILLLIIAGIFLFSGCSSTVKKQSILNVPERQPAVVELLSGEVDTGCSSLQSPSIDEKELRQMLRQARGHAAETEFHSADSLCRIVYSSVTEAGNFDSSFLPDRYIDEVIAVYVELMPDTFPIPDEIAPQVFHLQLVGSLDSLQFTPEDSAFIAGVFDRSQKIAYDVPVVWNSRVQRALFYYLTRNKSTIDRWRERSVSYLPFMKKMFADSGLPRDLAYLPLIESGFNAKAYSRSHASGIWQFISSTGKRYGLRKNYWIDERRDPVRATAAAIRYLKKLYGDFDHWHLALAAYNCGEGGLSRAIEKYKTNDYWQLKLPAETMNYVPLYLASLAIAKSPDFDGVFEGLADTVPFDTVTVNDCLDLRDVAEGAGVDYEAVRDLNPQLLHWCTPPDMTGILLYLPAGSSAAFRKYYTELPDKKKVKWYRYHVQAGDNLGSIARRFRLPVDGIKSVNRMKTTRIIAGKYLFIPIPVDAPGYRLPQEDEEKSVASRTGMSAEIPEGAKLTVYEVKPGDTVWRLAELFGVGARQICGWNNLVKSRIRVGQVLSIYTVPAPASGNTPDAGVSNSSSAGNPADRYVVCQGDNAFRIARRFGMTLDELYTRNGMAADAPVIRPGDTLLVNKQAGVQSYKEKGHRHTVPSDNSVVYVVDPGDNLFQIARNFSVTVERICSVNNLNRQSVIRAGDTLFIPVDDDQETRKGVVAENEIVFYKVRNGDNFWRIAADFGISVERLYEFNGLKANSVIMPGDTLRVVKRGQM
jgi:membrane-bound lytic murein transglycosylase D